MIYTDEQEEQIPCGPQRDCPLTLCVCSICALPARTCLSQLWPWSFERLGQHTVCRPGGIQKWLIVVSSPFPARSRVWDMLLWYVQGLSGWKVAQSVLPAGRQVADTWQAVMLKVYRGHKHWGSDYCFTCSSVTLHGFTVLQSWNEQPNTLPPRLHLIQRRWALFSWQCRTS